MTPGLRARWLLATLAVLAVLALAHLPTLGAAWRGDVAYAYPFEQCTSHYASRDSHATPGRPLPQGCDTLYTQWLAHDALARVEEAWSGRSSSFSFVVSDLPRVATESRTLGVVDLLLLVWPARVLLPPGPALAALHLGIVALAAASGVLFARLLGASPTAGLAAGALVGASGLVVESVTRGQYPQAVVLGALAFFAGLDRVGRGGRGGVALATAGASLACLLYWQNAVILGLGAGVFLVGARAEGPFAAGTWRRLALGAGLTALVCLPFALPVLGALGTEEKLAVLPWGTPYSVATGSLDLVDEVPWSTLLSPSGGWLPALPLLPLVAVGAARRSALPWVLLVGIGAVLALGPLPVLPAGLHGAVVDGYGTWERGTNPIYLLVYRWVPTASRMHHPLRWATLAVVGGAALAVRGFERLRGGWGDQARLAVAAGLFWVAWVGPWPLRQASLPAATRELAGCSSLLLPGVPAGEAAWDDLRRISGLLWLPVAPLPEHASGGTAGGSAAQVAWSEAQVSALDAALASGARADAPAGACVLYESGWLTGGLRSGAQAEDPVRARLARVFGTPTPLEFQGFFAPEAGTRRVEVYR